MERYSQEKHNSAKEDALSPDKREQLYEFRDLKRHWEKIKNTQGSDVIARAVERWKVFRAEPRFSMLDYATYLSENGWKHKRLEEAQSETKEGHMELAQREARFFNEAFDIRAERLQRAAEHKEESPAEYTAALASFDELIQDLKEGDLEKYEYALSDRAHNMEFRDNKPSDLQTEDEKQVEAERGVLRAKIVALRARGESGRADEIEKNLDSIARHTVRYRNKGERGSDSFDGGTGGPGLDLGGFGSSSDSDTGGVDFDL